MKFLLGYNMKIVALWGRGRGDPQKFDRDIFLGGGRLFKTLADDGVLVK